MKKPSTSRVLGSALFVIIAVGVITNWHLLVSLAVTLSADGTNESLYLNPTGTGKVVVGGDSLVLATKTSEPSSPSTGQVYFDTTTGTFRGYNGSVWVDLSEAVSAFPTNGLISYWKLDESSGNAADSYGSNTLTNSNSTAFTSGKINNGANFVASSQNYFTNSSNDFQLTGAFTMSFWVKLSSQPTGNTSFGLITRAGGTSEDGYAVFIGHRSETPDVGYNLGYYVVSGTNYTFAYANSGNTWLPTGEWHHVVVTFVPSTKMEVFLDGTSIYSNTTSIPGSIGVSTNPLNIGRRSTGDYYTDGIIDEVAIWSRALSTQEVEDLYNSGSGLSY